MEDSSWSAGGSANTLCSNLRQYGMVQEELVGHLRRVLKFDMRREGIKLSLSHACNLTVHTEGRHGCSAMIVL